jgi:hypothetical protein
MNGCFPDKAWIARKIVSYLSAHPDAQENVDGIVQWWLREQKSDLNITLAKEVLADLVTQGLIKKIQIEGQSSYYRIRPKHRE